MKLSPCQIESIQYRPGKENENADSLSCNPVQDTSRGNPALSILETAVNLWANMNILDEIRAQQETDPKLEYITDKLQNSSTPIFNEK